MRVSIRTFRYKSKDCLNVVYNLLTKLVTGLVPSNTSDHACKVMSMVIGPATETTTEMEMGSPHSPPPPPLSLQSGIS